MRAEAHEEETKVMWWGFALQDLEFQRISYQDLMFTMASIMFVYYYIAFYTNSIYIGGLGMMQIIFTLPLALFFYRGIFQVTFFNQLHVLAIYLVLGIGADDIFVFVDGWNQSINQYKNTADRLDVTYKRAVYAMGATSATTCVAFMATAISPIMPIASFGIYAALGVFLNYVLVITLFPCTLMIYHYKLYGCCKRLPKQVEMGMNLCAVPACHKRDEATCCCQQPFTLPPAVQNPLPLPLPRPQPEEFDAMNDPMPRALFCLLLAHAAVTLLRMQNLAAYVYLQRLCTVWTLWLV